MPTGPRIGRRALLSTAGSAATASIAGCSDVLASDPVTVEWDTTLPRVTGSVTVTDGHVWACTDSGLRVYDTATGEETGSNGHVNDPAYGEPVVRDGLAFYGTIVDNTVYAVSERGEVVWRTELPGSVTSCVLGDSTLFAATGVYGNGPGLYALDVGSGDEKWGVELDDHRIAGSPAVAAGRVFVESHGFAAFDSGSGDLAWRTELDEIGEVGEAARHRPGVDGSRTYYSHSLGSGLYALDVESGDEDWHFDTQERLSSPVARDGVVYVGKSTARATGTAAFYAVDAESGETHWTANVGQISLFGPSVTEDLVLTADTDTLYSLDRGSGGVEWEYEFDHTVQRPVVRGDRIYIAGHEPSDSNSRLYALSIE